MVQNGDLTLKQLHDTVRAQNAIINAQNAAINAISGDALVRRTVFDDTFGDGLRGWTGLIQSGENYYPSLHPAAAYGPRSMILDTNGLAATATANATKRAFAHRGLVRWFSRFTWSAEVVGVNGSNGPEANGLKYLKWQIDWQRGDETTGARRWWEIRYRHWDEAGAAITPLWESSNGAAGTMQTIAALSGYELGYNQAGKYDWHDIEIIVDTLNHQWVSMRLDNIYVDLSGQNHNGVQAGVVEFDNGSNYLFSCVNRTNNSASDPFMLVDRTKLEFYS